MGIKVVDNTGAKGRVLVSHRLIVVVSVFDSL